MTINVKMTKDIKNHKSFKITVQKVTSSDLPEILSQMEKVTGVPWKSAVDYTDDLYRNSKKVIIETGDLTRFFRKNHPEDEKSYVNWRMLWKNELVEITI